MARMLGKPHACNERCVCPVHGTPMIYWPAGDDHACQDVNCAWGHGTLGTSPALFGDPRDHPLLINPLT